MSEYFKSLISDEEVIKELIKDSQRLEGKLSNEQRLRPNLNFLQRTVSNLISTNTRISKGVDTFRTDYLKKSHPNKYRIPVYKSCPSKKPLVDYEFEKQLILQTKINFVKEKGNKIKLKEASSKFEPRKLSFDDNIIDLCSESTDEDSPTEKLTKKIKYKSKKEGNKRNKRSKQI